MGIKKATTLLDDFLHNAGGCAVIDGGFATQLEKHGAVINDPLWSAVCLINDPHLIKKVISYSICCCSCSCCFGASRSHSHCCLDCMCYQVHLEYLEAGADILVSSSYQVCNANGLSFLCFCTFQSVIALECLFLKCSTLVCLKLDGSNWIF